MRSDCIQNSLKEYRFNKARASFLKCQILRFSAETQTELEVNFRQEKSGNAYGAINSGAFGLILPDIQKEIKRRQHMVDVVDEALDMLGDVDLRYRMILEKYYIEELGMDEVARLAQVSRSKCYELCKEAVHWMSGIVQGNKVHRPVGI